MAFDANDYRITAYVYGELSDDERAAFEAEMATSAELRQTVEEIRHTAKLLQRELSNEPAIALTGAQRECLNRAINTKGGGCNRWFARRLDPFRERSLLALDYLDLRYRGQPVDRPGGCLSAAAINDANRTTFW